MQTPKHEADGVPDERGFFIGLAQAPLQFHNAVAELVDNSIAAKDMDFDIFVDISKPQPSGLYEFSVLDKGSGISLDLLKTHVFKTGKPPLQGSSHLREHGFGLKNVLAKVEFLGGKWELWTRDKDAQSNGVHYLIRCPLRYRYSIEDSVAPTSFPESGLVGMGTLVKASVPLSYLQTVSFGRRGAPPSTINTIARYLKEHLGVYYRGYLEGGRKSIGRIRLSCNAQNQEDVEPVSPHYATRIDVNKGRPFTVSTGKGAVKVSGWYGRLNKESDDTKKNRLYYYRYSPESQGIDFKIGNRVVATRLITEIWSVPRHPTLNAFCGEFQVHMESGGPVPSTLNNKTSLSFDDAVWMEIAEEIVRQVPIEELPRSKYTRGEKELQDELIKQLKGHFPSQKIEPEYECYSGAGVVADIVRFIKKKPKRVVAVYEVKSGKAVPIDVYQLMMYWDGLVDENIVPMEGLLVAATCTQGAKRVMSTANTFKDKAGNNYKFAFKSWKDFGITLKP